MLPMTSDYREAKDAEHRPLIFSMITTVRTRYIFADVWLTDDEIDRFGSLDFWNGTDATAGDGGTFGTIPVSYNQARVLSYGSLRETLTPQQDDLVASLAQTEIGSYSITYDNTDGFFSAMLGDDRSEPLIGQTLEIYQGFKGVSSVDFLPLFAGEITQITLTNETLRVIAEATATVFPVFEEGVALTAYALGSAKAEPGTILLIHSDTTNGDTTFDDDSPSAHTITGHGGIAHSTAQAKFGTSSILFDGSTEYLSIPDSADWDFGTGDFTVEMFLYIPSTDNSKSLFGRGSGSSTVHCFGYGYGGIQPNKAFGHRYGDAQSVYSSIAIPTGQWVHVAFVRNSGTLAIYFNGVSRGSGANTRNITGSDAVYLGWNAQQIESGVDPYFDGYMDEIRISNVARNPADFPPTSRYSGGVVNPVFARSTFTHADLANVFFATDTWACNINFEKDRLDDAGVLFSLENNGTVTTLEIGIDATNHPYVTTGQSVEGTPATTTYTDTNTLTEAMISGHLNLRIFYDHGNSLIYFTLNGSQTSQAATSPYDRTGTNNEQVTAGDDFGGWILNVKFNDTFWATNNLGSDAISSFPDVIGGHDLAIVDGTWEAW
jgi:hypothetical protein